MRMNEKKKSEYFLPFLLTAIVIGLDQCSKILIVATIEPWAVGFEFFGDLLRIVCVYNTGAAFSLGHTLSGPVRLAVLAFIPTLFICGICVIYFKTDFARIQRWLLCGIIGGGISNLIDRFFRPEGVVDFIDVKFFGLFGLERWPTFNIADSVIVVCSFVLLISVAIQDWKKKQVKTHQTDTE